MNSQRHSRITLQGCQADRRANGPFRPPSTSDRYLSGPSLSRALCIFLCQALTYPCTWQWACRRCRPHVTRVRVRVARRPPARARCPRLWVLESLPSCSFPGAFAACLVAGRGVEPRFQGNEPRHVSRTFARAPAQKHIAVFDARASCRSCSCRHPNEFTGYVPSVVLSACPAFGPGRSR